MSVIAGRMNTPQKLLDEARAYQRPLLEDHADRRAFLAAWKFARDVGFNAIALMGGVQFRRTTSDWPTPAVALAALEEIIRWCRSDEATVLAGGERANSANTANLFPKGVPDNPDIVDLVCQLDAENGKAPDKRRSIMEIARKLTKEVAGNCPKADTLTSQVRRLRREGRITL